VVEGSIKLTAYFSVQIGKEIYLSQNSKKRDSVFLNILQSIFRLLLLEVCISYAKLTLKVQRVFLITHHYVPNNVNKKICEYQPSCQ